MADLASLYDESALAIVISTDRALAQTRIAEVLNQQSSPLPMWTWETQAGLQPIGDADGVPWKAGAHPGKVAKALDAARNQSVCLVVIGADGLDTTSVALLQAIARQVREKPTSWVVLLSSGPNLEDLLSQADLAPGRITVDLRGSAQAVQVASKPPTAKLSLDDLESLERFDSEEWTEHLNNLPLAELKKICDGELYEESRSRVEALCASMKKIFVQKDELIDLMAACAIAQLPMLLLGPWGTGKSLLVRQFAQGLGIRPEERSINTEDELVRKMTVLAQQRRSAPTVEALQEIQNLVYENHSARHFEYLVTRFTTPEELLGPVNIEALLSSALYLRQTRSLLPRAEIVFLDEVFKANSAILNALLSIMNERLFHNAGVPWSVNMIMLFGASNEPPQEADLGAFFDRFPVRAMCNPVSNDKLADLLSLAHAQQMLTLLPRGAKPAETAELAPELKDRRIKQEACVNDFRLLRKVCLYRYGGADTNHANSKGFTDRFLQIYRQLREEYDLSDRSCAHFYRLARSRALLNRRDQLREEDCKVLHYCGNSPESLRDLPGVVDGMIS